MTDITLFDDKNQTSALISFNGELIVGPISYSTPYYVSVDSLNIAKEVVPAKSGNLFIITGLLIASSKTFGTATTAETVTIYESSPADLTTQLKIITQVDLLKNDRLAITGLNLASSEAVSLTAIATDTNVDVTIAGYYINN